MRSFNVLTAMILTLCSADPLFAADTLQQRPFFAAADTAYGYGADVLEKLAGFWTPPEGISGVVTVSIRIGSDGRPLYCETIKRSGNANLDDSPCQAVLRAQSFAAPPNGVITQVFVTLATDRSIFYPPAQTAGHSPSYAQEIIHRATPYIQLPKQISGEFSVTVRLRVNQAGGLENLSVIQSSGNTEVDQIVIAAITREGVIPTPPSGSHIREVELLFTLHNN